MSEPTPSDLLARAAELIGERGWCQGTIKTAEGHMCAMGAMAEAKRELFGPENVRRTSRIYADAMYSLVDVINEPHGYSSLVSVPQWNDEEDQTAENVILALKTAANNN